MQNKFLCVIALSCGLLTNAANDSGHIGWVRHEGEWVSVYDQVGKMNATSNVKCAYMTSKTKSFCFSKLCFLERDQNDGRMKRRGEIVEAEMLPRICMHALAAITVAAVSSVAVVTLINKYCKKEISKKKAAAIAVGSAVIALAAYYATFGPYIVVNC